VVALSATNVWAVGGTTNDPFFQTMTEHWNGTQWKVVPSPSPGSGGSYVGSVAAISAKDVWTVGSSGWPGTETLTEHWTELG
jgi:hypothetical protein